MLNFALKTFLNDFNIDFPYLPANSSNFVLWIPKIY